MELRKIKNNRESYFFNFDNDRLFSSKIGDMVLCNLEEDNVEGPTIYIKEKISKIKSLTIADSIEIDFKVKRIKIDEVEAIMLLIKINKDDNLIYVQWFNLLDRTDVFNLIDLNYIKNTTIKFIDYKNQVISEISVKNTLKDKIKPFIIPMIYSANWKSKSFDKKICFVKNSVTSNSELYHSRKRIYKFT